MTLISQKKLMNMFGMSSYLKYQGNVSAGWSSWNSAPSGDFFFLVAKIRDSIRAETEPFQIVRIHSSISQTQEEVRMSWRELQAQNVVSCCKSSDSHGSVGVNGSSGAGT